MRGPAAMGAQVFQYHRLHVTQRVLLTAHMQPLMRGPAAVGAFMEAYMVSEFSAVFGNMTGVPHVTLAEVQVRSFCLFCLYEFVCTIVRCDWQHDRCDSCHAG